MRGAKPSSGLVHLHKSFVELHFAGKPLPQNVTVQACVDGKALETVLPGQVYSTSCGQDHWLLGLQFIFKAYKEPLITHVDKTGDSQVSVAIATQGLQDKYSSCEPVRRAELQRAMEAAALKFAQTAVMRKEGRLQVSGPNINIPKKQLRAQWPAILERLVPLDVQAHIFVDSPDSYIACAAKIILTKAKAEPVFYLSGLSQLLKSFKGAFVTLELLPEEQVVRLNIDTGQQQHQQQQRSMASMSTTAVTQEAGETSSAAMPAARDAAAAGAESQADNRAPQQLAADAAAADGCAAAVAAAGSASASQVWQCGEGSGQHWAAAAAAAAPGGFDCPPAGAGSPCDGAAAAAGQVGNGLLAQHEVPSHASAAEATLPSTLPKQHCRLLSAVIPPASDAPQAPQAPQAPYLLEGMASSSNAPIGSAGAPWPAPVRLGHQMSAVHRQVTVPADSGSSKMPPQGIPGRSTGHAPHPDGAEPAAAAAAGPVPAPAAAAATTACMTGAAGAATAPSGGDANAVMLPSSVLVAPSGVTAGSDAGLWLLADHAAQLQAVGSSGDLSLDAAAAAAAAARQQAAADSWVQQGPVSSSKDHLLPVSTTISSSRGHAGAMSAAGRALVREAVGVGGAAEQPAAAAAMEGITYPAMDNAAMDGSIHPAALPQEGYAGVGVSAAAMGPAGPDSSAACYQAAGLRLLRSLAPHSAPGAVAGHEMVDQPAEFGARDRWQLHPKRRRTAAGSSAAQQVQQVQHEQLPPPLQLDGMGTPMYNPAAAGQAAAGACGGSRVVADYLLLQQQQLAAEQLAAEQLAAEQVAQHHQQQQRERRHSASGGGSSIAVWPHSPRSGVNLKRRSHPGSASPEAPTAAGGHSGRARPGSATAAAGRSDDVMCLARQQEEQGDMGGAVAVVHRVSSCAGDKQQQQLLLLLQQYGSGELQQQGPASGNSREQQQQQLLMPCCPHVLHQHQQQQLHPPHVDMHGCYAHHPAVHAGLHPAAVQGSWHAAAAGWGPDPQVLPSLTLSGPAAAWGASCSKAPAPSGPCFGGQQPRSGSGVITAHWSPALLSSPTSGTSSFSRMAAGPGSQAGSAPGSCSPGCMAGAAGGSGAGAGRVSNPASMHGASSGEWGYLPGHDMHMLMAAGITSEAAAAVAQQHEQHWQQQQQLWWHMQQQQQYAEMPPAVQHTPSSRPHGRTSSRGARPAAAGRAHCRDGGRSARGSLGSQSAGAAATVAGGGGGGAGARLPVKAEPTDGAVWRAPAGGNSRPSAFSAGAGDVHAAAAAAEQVSNAPEAGAAHNAATADRQASSSVPACVASAAAAAAAVAQDAAAQHNLQQQQQQLGPAPSSSAGIAWHAAAAAAGDPGTNSTGSRLCDAAAAGDVIGSDGWPVLPDADSLLLVGKGLVQVMNLLGAGSDARLALTRSLRGMSPQDREWLLAITYPHLQDSCRRRALPEMRMILNEVVGLDCFACTAHAAHAAVGAEADGAAENAPMGPVAGDGGGWC